METNGSSKGPAEHAILLTHFPDMQSPVAALLNAIAGSPFRVAPETAADLHALVISTSLALEFCDDKRLFAEFVVSRKLIRIGLPFLEVLWAAAHAYVLIFHECQQASIRGETTFAVGERTRTAMAYKLYRDLLLSHAAGNSIKWPSRQVRPVCFPQQGTDIHVANEVFLVAISWIIHHEIAHARLEHQEVTVSSVQEENEADHAATRWVCYGKQETEPLRKCAIGIVTAVLLLIAYDFEVRRNCSSDHPPSFERLVLNLDATGLGENDMIYAFAFKLVEIHLVQFGAAYEIDRQGSFRDMCVSACLAVREAVNGG